MKRSFWGRTWYRLARLFRSNREPAPADTAAPTPAASDDVTRPTADSPAAAEHEVEATTPTVQQSAQQPQPTKSQAPDGHSVFGIDFGTTFTSIAVVVNGRLSVVRDAEQQQPMFPSVVCYPQRDAAAVGWDGRSESIKYPKTTFTSPKRLLGRRYDDRNVEPALASLSVPTRAGPNGQVVADVHGDTVAITQVCAEIFRHAGELGLRATGRAVKRVVVSVPVEYQTERKAIKRAAELSGLEVVGMIEEPVAAAIGCGFGRQAGIVAVYDFGGGTFDCTALEVRGGQFRVLGKAGDAWLGGDDFDLALAEHAARGFWRQWKVDLQQRKVEWQRLVYACESAKRQLSTETEVEIHLPNLVLSSRGPIDLRMSLTRPLLAQLCTPLIERSIDAMTACLDRAGAKPGDVTHVAMTGGVSCMPLVRDYVQKYFGRSIPEAVNPLHAVVAGNAIFANFLTARPGGQNTSGVQAATG